jgi:hypothetical protein
MVRLGATDTNVGETTQRSSCFNSASAAALPHRFPLLRPKPSVMAVVPRISDVALTLREVRQVPIAGANVGAQ